MKTNGNPGQCGSVGWSIIPWTEGSWVLHMPRLQVQSLVGVRRRRRPVNATHPLLFIKAGGKMSSVEDKKRKRKKMNG